MKFKIFGLRYSLNSFLFFIFLLSATCVNSQTNEIEDFSRERFIENYEDDVHESLFMKSSNEVIEIYALWGRALMHMSNRKDPLEESLQKMARKKNAEAYQLVESKRSLNDDEQEEFILNRLAPDNFIVLFFENNEEELRLYKCIYEK